jgi:hypothetical protein
MECELLQLSWIIGGFVQATKPPETVRVKKILCRPEFLQEFMASSTVVRAKSCPPPTTTWFISKWDKIIWKS